MLKCMDCLVPFPHNYRMRLLEPRFSFHSINITFFERSLFFNISFALSFEEAQTGACLVFCMAWVFFHFLCLLMDAFVCEQALSMH